MAAISWKYYIVFCCVIFVELWLIYFLFPETKGMSLHLPFLRFHPPRPHPILVVPVLVLVSTSDNLITLSNHTSLRNMGRGRQHLTEPPGRTLEEVAEVFDNDMSFMERTRASKKHQRKGLTNLGT